MPFDITTPLGYSVTLATQIIGVLIIGEMICLIDALFLAMCWYHGALINDSTKIIHNCDRIWINGTQTDFFDAGYKEKEIQSLNVLIEFVDFNCEIFR